MNATMKKTKLDNLQRTVELCVNCGLCKTRKNVVFGEGSCTARIMLIGEAPGKEEDINGLPFVGLSGKLLTRIFKDEGLSRDRIYITNIVKCRPTLFYEGKKDRKPTIKEMKSCEQYLVQQIDIISPRIIITVGNTSSQYICNTKSGITYIHGKVFTYCDIPVIPMYHPSYILRNGGYYSHLKNDMVDDLKILKQTLINMK